MAAGTVVWISASDGHTFVAPEAGGRDLFVRVPGGARVVQLPIGAAVEFDIAYAAKGHSFATNVVLTKRPDATGIETR